MAHRHNTFRRMAIGSALMAGIGYLAGLLTAPQSGKETREDLKKTADQRLADTEKDLKSLYTELGKAITDTRKNNDKLGSKAQKELNEVLDRAKDTKEKVREVISALHEGDAQDRDLNNAIKDATAALSHLRDYLKK